MVHVGRITDGFSVIHTGGITGGLPVVHAGRVTSGHPLINVGCIHDTHIQIVRHICVNGIGTVTTDGIGIHIPILILRRNEICHEFFVTGLIGACKNDSFADRGMCNECRLDLSELDPESSDLHLRVDTSKKLDISIGKIPHTISRLIEPCTYFTAERIGNKLLRRQFGATPIAASQSRATDMQFARNTDRYRLQVPVKDVESRVGDGTANRNRTSLRIFPLHFVDTAADDGFCGAIFIDEPRRGRMLPP